MNVIKYNFSGHESFQCRSLWLKKGYDFVSSNGHFSREDAVVSLGVGKNMVTAIRFWMKAFNIITVKDEITVFGRSLLNDDGWDPYLEDDASLWLLHYQLVKNNFASTYNIIFNEFRREKIEFTRDTFVAYIKKRAEFDENINFTQNTVEADFDVFKKMYLSSLEDSKNAEDTFSGLLCDLKLVQTYKREKADWSGKKETTTRYDCFYIENSERPKLPSALFLYAIADNFAFGKSISLRSLENDINSPGSVFALNRSGILDKISELTESHQDINYYDQAGIKELQFAQQLDPLTVLKQYYEG
jgi:hypothetical protein